jgi:ABC-type nitrate/sulfonate/bicarbonate transport system substrate-binding protein
MTRTAIFRLIVLIALIAAIVGVVWSTRPPGPADRTLAHLVVADGQQVTSALFYIALAKGYFADEGLNVELKRFNFSRDAVAAMLDGQAEVAMASEVPMMHAIRKAPQVKIIATVQTSDRDIMILARRDRAIAAPADLAGKRVAYIPATNSEMFLQLFLAAHNLTHAVQLVPVKTTEAVAALVEGTVDALSGWTVLRFSADSQLGGQAVTLAEKGIYTELWALAATEAVVAGKPDALQKLLKALVRAEEVVNGNQSEAIDLVAAALNQSRERIAEVWDNFDFAVGLGQTVVINLEYAAGLGQEGQGAPMPNFAESIVPHPLLAVNPGRVTLPR